MCLFHQGVALTFDISAFQAAGFDSISDVSQK